MTSSISSMISRRRLLTLSTAIFAVSAAGLLITRLWFVLFRKIASDFIDLF